MMIGIASANNTQRTEGNKNCIRFIVRTSRKRL